MQFIVIAHDYKEGGLEKRLAVRDQHIKMGDQMKANGNYIMGVALLDDSDKMIGSVMILEYPSRKELDAWLTVEPYVVNNVWEKIEITPCKIGPTFLK
ncbi:MAG TPA: YciI family protein [Candidatus Saccharimonadales bacterium]|nr:YciI family protein [Candidatus Saccharimonadales bacterium]HSW97147.1 YciI family protein [Candidatus Saccharimonadales bacterium]